MTLKVTGANVPDFHTTRPISRMPSADALNNGHALSFHTQPYIRDLFVELATGQSPVTFVVGAGVSIDSGLWSWDRLLEKLCDSIKDDGLRKLALQDATDGPLRKAESIFRLISPGSTATDPDILRDTLYSELPETDPGLLAQAIARICVSLDKRASLLTTNFDDVLETALSAVSKGEVRAHALFREDAGADDAANTPYDGIDDWKQERDQFGPLAVMHLHGMTRRRMTPLRPIVLSESQFLRHGPEVRRLISAEIQRGVVIFIGVSLTDPNLIGPLWDLAQSGSKQATQNCFILHVPNLASGTDSMSESRSYSLAKYEYFESALNVKPIFFKSYSQMNQALQELSYCLVVGNDYFENAGDGSDPVASIYGHRFQRTLDLCYRAVHGENATDDAFDFVHSQEFALKLGSLIEPGTPAGDILLSPSPLVRRRKLELMRAFRDLPDESEHFGLFLWLRCRKSIDDINAPYAISMAAASNYVHFERWSFERIVEIAPRSGYPAAESMFHGLAQLTNLRLNPPNIWRGSFAIPLHVPADLNLDATEPNSTLLVGALVLNTTHDIYPWLRDADEVRPRVSILTAISQETALAEELGQYLLDNAVALMAGRPHGQEAIASDPRPVTPPSDGPVQVPSED